MLFTTNDEIKVWANLEPLCLLNVFPVIAASPLSQLPFENAQTLWWSASCLYFVTVWLKVRYCMTHVQRNKLPNILPNMIWHNMTYRNRGGHSPVSVEVGFMLGDSAPYNLRSVQMQEILCLIYSEAESKGVEVGVVGVVDGHVQWSVWLSCRRQKFASHHRPAILRVIMLHWKVIT